MRKKLLNYRRGAKLDDPSSDSFYSVLKNSITKRFRKAEKKQKKSEEIELINNLEEYFDTTIREVMVPRTLMVTIDKDRPIDEVIKLIHETGHSRIPVQDKNPDNIVGIIHAIDLFKYFYSPPNISIDQLMRKPLFASYSQPINLLLSMFKLKRTQLAIVIDEHGGVDGLVTIQDVIEELVGDIPDEFNKNNDPTYQTLEEGLIVMDANYPLDEFNELYQTDFQKEGIETIGGFICHKASKIPERGEEFNLEGIGFVVQQSDEKQLVKLRITSPALISSR